MIDDQPRAGQADDFSTEFGLAFDPPAPTAAPAPASKLPATFDEAKYLRAYPDVANAVAAGGYASGRDHCTQYGLAEGRLDALVYRHCWPLADSPGFPLHGIDAVFRTANGRVLVIGWIHDVDSPLHSLSLVLHQTLLGVTAGIARCRREDAERATGAVEGQLLGFWTVLEARTDVPTAELRIVLMTATQQRAIPVTVQQVTDERLRELVFEYFAHASYYGNPQVEAAEHLDGGLGQVLIDASADISARYVAGAFCRRFGPQQRRFRGSLIICLYGRPEYMFLQAAFFTVGTNWADYEFVYVCNSPELTETLLKESAISASIYGISISLVILPGNAGFGAANNIAVAFAQSDRILITNPDVFPRDADWASRHSALVDGLPEEQSRFFGAPLFYDDGSMMHAGMFFELDEGYSVTTAGIRQRSLVRVEHYGKGAPPQTRHLLQSRPVPAVTGAFMSIDRGWYERLGGFSPAFVFGHYEDADLCLRSLTQGCDVWIHDLKLWHLEGKGSNRRTVHEGGSLVNRWHFTRLWTDLIRDGLLGPAPTRFAATVLS